MNSNHVDERPTTITVAEFVAGDYAAKIARGECVVTDYKGNAVLNIEPPEYGEAYNVVCVGDKPTWGYLVVDKFELTVEWLPATDRDAAAPLLPQTVNTIRYGTPEFAALESDYYEAEIARLSGLLADALLYLTVLLTDHTQYVNYVHSHGFKVSRPNETYSLQIRQEVTKFGRDANREQNSAMYSASEPDHR